MFFKKVHSFIIIISSCIFAGSCDFSADSHTDTVSGNIYDYSHVPVENLKVTIQDKSVYTSPDGSFKLNGISFPYDVILTDSAHRKAFVFKKISVNNINLPVDQNIGNYIYSSINVRIQENANQSGKKWKVIFTDREYINEYAEVSGINPTADLSIRMHNSSVSGMIIALSYIKDNNGKIISYENFGSIPVYNIQSGNTYDYWFDSLSVSLNPGEQSVFASIDVIAMPYFTEFYLNFGTTDILENFGHTFSYLTGYYFNFKIPTGLSLPYRTVINNDAILNEGFTSQQYTINPDLSNDLTVNIPPVLLYPEENAKNVNSGTQFSFNAGMGEGIYEIELYNMSRITEYRIITSDMNFNLDGLEDLGFGNINNNVFRWKVTKRGPAVSVNDYVTNYFNVQNHFYSESLNRNFLTEP